VESEDRIENSCSTLGSWSADPHLAGDVDRHVQSLRNPEPNQTKPNQNLLINGISFPNLDWIYPFDMMNCTVKAILY
jgi:hypothetical protein